MGDTIDGEPDAMPPVTVMVSAFYMDATLVSYKQWRTVYDWAATQGYRFDNAGLGKAENHPVYRLDWFSTVKWCNARSQQEGLTPVYYTDAELTQVYTTGDVKPFPNWVANGYRLPTEAEWEKAARGGLNGQRFPWGSTISEDQANYKGCYDCPECGACHNYDNGPNGFNKAFEQGDKPYTNPTNYFSPNGYGLYDMAGNIFQWCWDWFGTLYAGGSDPRGPGQGDRRVLRGGSFEDYATNERCAHRQMSLPVTGDAPYGFRCVRNASEDARLKINESRP